MVKTIVQDELAPYLGRHKNGFVKVSGKGLRTGRKAVFIACCAWSRADDGEGMAMLSLLFGGTRERNVLKDKLSITQNEITKMVKEHGLWLSSGGAMGKRADFSNRDLRGKNLSGSVLSGAIFDGAIVDRTTRMDALFAPNSSFVGFSAQGGVRLDGSFLAYSNWCDADLRGAYVDNRTVFEGGTISETTQLNGIQGNERVIENLKKLGLSRELREERKIKTAETGREQLVSSVPQQREEISRREHLRNMSRC